MTCREKLQIEHPDVADAINRNNGYHECPCDYGYLEAKEKPSYCPVYTNCWGNISPLCQQCWDMNASECREKEQKAEIEKLYLELVAANGTADTYKLEYDIAQEEIERLKKENETWHHIYKVNGDLIMRYDDKVKELRKKLQTAKSEARKELAERLKEKYKRDFNDSYRLIYDTIDNLVKEMEKNDGILDY